MRTKFTKVFAAMTLAAAIVGATAAAPAESEPLDTLDPVVSVVGVTSTPAAVRPAGASVLYTVTVSNPLPAPAPVTVTDSTTNGSLVSVSGMDCEPPASTIDPTFTCSGTVDALGTATLLVTIRTTELGTTTNTANVRFGPATPAELEGVDLAVLGQTATVSTPVTDQAGSKGFVPQGGTLQFKNHVLTVLSAEVGVVAEMKDSVVAPTTQCGTTSCNSEGLNVTFEGGENSESTFFGVVEVDVRLDNGDPCFGNGTPRCFGLYYLKPGMLTTAPVPDCLEEDTPLEGKAPCLEDFEKVATGFSRDVVMETDDPDLLEAAKSLVGGNV